MRKTPWLNNANSQKTLDSWNRIIMSDEFSEYQQSETQEKCTDQRVVCLREMIREPKQRC